MLRTPAIAALLLVSCSTAGATDWPQFRGPGGLSVADDTPIPTVFGPDDAVLWSAAIPAGHSSPCIVGGLIFLTGFEDGENVLVAIDREDGTQQWRKTFTGTPHPEYYHVDAVPALQTPISDGLVLVASFDNYGLVVLDFEGEVIWEKRLPHPGHGFGVGSSPLLVDGLIVLSRDGGPEAGILGFDVLDGTELWRIDRFDYGEAHSTPFLWNNADRDELVIAGTNRLCSYDPGSGELLWFVDGLTVFPCATPTADEDMLYFAAWSTPNSTGRSYWEAGFARSLELSDEEINDPSLLFARLDTNHDGKIVLDELPECRAKDAFGFLDRDHNGSWEVGELRGAENSAPGKNRMVAVARGGNGDASETHVRWSHDRGLPYVASPLLYRGRIWLFKSGGVVTCLDAKTGAPIFERQRLADRSEYYMSPVGAAGRVLVGSAEGTMFVIDATADELIVESATTFEEELFATPAVLDGTIYLRCKSTLWAFAEVTPKRG